MSWVKKKREYKGALTNYSLLNKLRKENKTTNEFEIMLSNLSLEELIGMKLELASNSAGGYLYGLPLWKSIPEITREACFNYAISACRTKKEAARLLGITVVYLRKLYERYDTIKNLNPLEIKLIKMKTKILKPIRPLAIVKTL